MNKQKPGILFPLLLCIVVLFIISCRTTEDSYLQFYSIKKDRIVIEFPVCEGEKFELEYIHSAEKTPIHDYFTVDTSGSITLTEERFNWYAVGLESHPEYSESKIIFEGGETRVLLNRVFDPLPIRVGWIAQQVITLQDRKIVLREITDPGDLLYISIVKKQ